MVDRPGDHENLMNVFEEGWTVYETKELIAGYFLVEAKDVTDSRLTSSSDGLRPGIIYA